MLEVNGSLHDLLIAALHFYCVAAKVLQIDVAYDKQAFDAVRRRNVLYLVKLVGLYLGLDVEVTLAKVPAHIAERIALDHAAHLGIGVYVGHLVHHLRVARDRGRKVDGERHERLGRLSQLVDGRDVLGVTLVGAAILAAHARYLEYVAVEDGGHFAEATPLDHGLRVAVGVALEYDFGAGLGVDVGRDVVDVGRTEYVQVGQLEYLALRVRYLALDRARVRLLDGPKYDLVDFVALFAAAQSIVKGVGDGGAVADDAPRLAASLSYAPQNGWLYLFGRVDILQVASNFNRLARSRLNRMHLNLLHLNRTQLSICIANQVGEETTPNNNNNKPQLSTRHFSLDFVDVKFFFVYLICNKIQNSIQ